MSTSSHRENFYLDQAQKVFSQEFPGLSLREKQKEILGHLVSRKHVFGSLPTGYGKSACFWLPAKAWGWRVLVVSPLISLMEDQEISLRRLGIDPLVLHSNLSPGKRSSRECRLRFGSWSICIVSPEFFSHEWETGAYRSIGFDLLVIDEMHCLEEWKNFRMSYTELFSPVRRAVARGASVLGLSASMPRMQSDIWMQEFVSHHQYVNGGLGRENLSLFVLPLEEANLRYILLLELLKNSGKEDTTLVYCHTREDADALAMWLHSVGIAPVAAYHAGMPAYIRRDRSRAFREGIFRVICATSAFGMGVDYAKVRRVVHFSMPYSLESYWQEVGRAGRDGESAIAVAFWKRSDIAIANTMSIEAKEKFFDLWKLWGAGVCRKGAVALQLGWKVQPCGRCDRCLHDRKEGWVGGMHTWSDLWKKNIWWLQDKIVLEQWAKKKIFLS